jgi:CheY-like chemotaxis protein
MRKPMPTVLVADDSPVSLLTVTRRLRAEGYVVHEHPSAASARSETGAGLACALLDLDLGDGEGTDVALALHANVPELPVAFFSASVADDVLTRARAIGPVFTKPDQLDAAILWVRAHAESAPKR